MDASAVSTMITSLLGDIGTILVSGIGLVLGIVAALIGLFFCIRLVKKWIGKGK